MSQERRPETEASLAETDIAEVEETSEPPFWEANRILHVLCGSRAYGLETPESDWDTRGVCIPPKRYLLGIERFEQHVSPDDDHVVYSLEKFVRLALAGNPNVVETLFSEGEALLEVTPLGEHLIANRDLFLSRRVGQRFCGYAREQLHRIRRHRRWIEDPPSEPSPQAFGGREEGGRLRWSNASAQKAYKAAHKRWRQFQEWRQNRNPKRARLEAQHGYDCYAADTLFLTDSGWKHFDEIGEEDLLATVYVQPDTTSRKFGRVEYQRPTERFDGSFNGNMYRISGHHTDVLVTPNHRMLYRETSRKLNETYGVVLEEAARLPDCFEFLRTVTPRKKRYSTKKEFEGLSIKPEVYLRLMGWYLSDGSCALRETKRGTTVKEVRISQKSGGRLHQSMSKCQNLYGEELQSSLYSISRVSQHTGEEFTEVVLSIRDRVLRERIIADCGRTTEKHIPRWVFGLSKRHMEILFDAMYQGDGTRRKSSKQSLIYYSSLAQLANDVNELALLCGWETSIWGPYTYERPGVMYQVHVDKNAPRYQRFMRSTNVERVPVKNQRIVCFSVPNGTLITRRNGRVGIHGNSKHAMHLCRLLVMGEEILETGRVQVLRPDGAWLRAVRQGLLSYRELVEWADARTERLQELEASSPLPPEPDEEAAAELVVELQEAFHYG